MEKEKNKTLIDRIWDLFASVKLAVVIFALIALTSIVGTVLEQNAEPEKNIKIIEKFVGEAATPPVYGALQKLGFMDMYHSWWFVAFLLLFAANLIICSLDRLPRIWKIVREPIRPLEVSLIEKMSIRRTLVYKGKLAGTRETVARAFKEIGFAPLQSEGSGSVQFYAEKGNYSRLGVYVTHFSILVILAGAIIGLFLGFNAYLNLPEGRTSSVAYKEKGTEVPLGFELRCDNFEVEFYGESDMPKAYKSWLSVYKNGQKVASKSIVVNDPLTYDGITFYQSSFGTLPDSSEAAVIILKAVSADGRSEEIHARVGDTFKIPGSSVSGRIMEFIPALSFGPDGKAFSYDQNMKNPGIYVDFTAPGQKGFAGWLLKRLPSTWNLPDGSRVEFLDVWGIEYTGLQVRKDPGVGIVYFGCIMMAFGLYVTFFMSHRRIWINLVEEKGGVRITLGGSAHRNRASFERKVDKLIDLVGAAPKGGHK